jgi:hypothetical protein
MVSSSVPTQTFIKRCFTVQTQPLGNSSAAWWVSLMFDQELQGTGCSALVRFASGLSCVLSI